MVKVVKSISSKDTIIGFRNILYKLGSFLMDFKHNLKKVGCVIYQIVGIFMSNSIMMLISLIDNDNCTKIYYWNWIQECPPWIRKLPDGSHSILKDNMGVIYQSGGIFGGNSIMRLISLRDIIINRFRNVLYGSGSFLME